MVVSGLLKDMINDGPGGLFGPSVDLNIFLCFFKQVHDFGIKVGLILKQLHCSG